MQRPHQPRSAGWGRRFRHGLGNQAHGDTGCRLVRGVTPRPPRQAMTVGEGRQESR